MYRIKGLSIEEAGNVAKIYRSSACATPLIPRQPPSFRPTNNGSLHQGDHLSGCGCGLVILRRSLWIRPSLSALRSAGLFPRPTLPYLDAGDASGSSMLASSLTEGASPAECTRLGVSIDVVAVRRLGDVGGVRNASSAAGAGASIGLSGGSEFRLAGGRRKSALVAERVDSVVRRGEEGGEW